MHLMVTVQSEEFEATHDLGVVADEAAADAVLVSRSDAWLEATLCPARRDSTREAWRPARRRFPSSRWCDVRHWGSAPDYTMPVGTPKDASVEALAEWLRRAGVDVTHEGLRRAGPWPGFQERFPGEVEPDHRLRIAERHGEDALETVLYLVLREGAEWAYQREGHRRRL